MNDQFFIYAKPKLTDVNPYTIVLLTPNLSSFQVLDITIKGNLFLQLKNVYLSASNSNMFDGITLFNPFSAILNLSASNLPFSAIQIPSFTYQDHYISITLPQTPKTEGYIDIIVENEAGYGRLTEGSIIPFLSAYNGAVNIQKPCISGINIKY